MSSHSPPEETGPDVLNSAYKLALILKQDPEALDTGSWSRGEKFLTLANDLTFAERTTELVEQKIKIIKQAIEDLSDRGPILAEAFMGLTLFENQIETFICQYGEKPSGKIVFKIGIKNIKSFMEWRQGAKGQVSEQEINSGIYRLAALWAELL